MFQKKLAIAIFFAECEALQGGFWSKKANKELPNGDIGWAFDYRHPQTWDDLLYFYNSSVSTLSKELRGSFQITHEEIKENEVKETIKRSRETVILVETGAAFEFHENLRNHKGPSLELTMNHRFTSLKLEQSTEWDGFKCGGFVLYSQDQSTSTKKVVIKGLVSDTWATKSRDTVAKNLDLTDWQVTLVNGNAVDTNEAFVRAINESSPYKAKLTLVKPPRNGIIKQDGHFYYAYQSVFGGSAMYEIDLKNSTYDTIHMTHGSSLLTWTRDRKAFTGEKEQRWFAHRIIFFDLWTNGQVAPPADFEKTNHINMTDAIDKLDTKQKFAEFAKGTFLGNDFDSCPIIQEKIDIYQNDVHVEPEGEAIFTLIILKKVISSAGFKAWQPFGGTSPCSKHLIAYHKLIATKWFVEPSIEFVYHARRTVDMFAKQEVNDPRMTRNLKVLSVPEAFKVLTVWNRFLKSNAFKFLPDHEKTLLQQNVVQAAKSLAPVMVLYADYFCKQFSKYVVDLAWTEFWFEYVDAIPKPNSDSTAVEDALSETNEKIQSILSPVRNCFDATYPADWKIVGAKNNFWELATKMVEEVSQVEEVHESTIEKLTELHLKPNWLDASIYLDTILREVVPKHIFKGTINVLRGKPPQIVRKIVHLFGEQLKIAQSESEKFLGFKVIDKFENKEKQTKSYTVEEENGRKRYFDEI